MASDSKTTSGNPKTQRPTDVEVTALVDDALRLSDAVEALLPMLRTLVDEETCDAIAAVDEARFDLQRALTPFGGDRPDGAG